MNRYALGTRLPTAISGLLSTGFAFAATAPTPVVFAFPNGTALDQAGIGASMVVDGVTITTLDIMGQDGSRASDGADHRTNLSNSADLPASPFRLDDWPSLYGY